MGRKVGFQPQLGGTPEDSATGIGKQQRAKRLILCTNVLPVKLWRDESGRWNAEFDRENLYEDGPMYVSLRGMQDDMEVMHVGVPNAYVPDSDHAAVEEILSELNCFPVFCDAQRAHNHFQGYCKGILWPTFHNIIDLYSKMGTKMQGEVDVGASLVGGGGTTEASLPENEENWAPTRSWSPMEAETCWPDYCAVQSMFASKVVEIYAAGAVIWVHDYHLLLLPSYLIRKLPDATVGLFLHVPFPSSEIFRTLATREEILQAMLHADHIGFDLFEYARHFLTCCKRMLGLTYEPRKGGVIVIHSQDHDVSVTCTHIGLDTKYVLHRLESAEMPGLVSKFQRQFQDLSQDASSNHTYSFSKMQRRKVMLGIDEVEGLRGIGLKLLALDRLFVDYPHLRNAVTLKQIGLHLDSRPDDYEQCHAEVMRLVDALRNKWGSSVVEYEERKTIGLTERLALMQCADVFVNSSVRVGIDMLPFEYLFARRGEAGAVIVSEFSACSRVLFGSLRVNPFKTSALAATMEEAFSMLPAERTARCARDLDYIERNNIQDWSQRLLEDMMDAHGESRRPLTKIGGGFGTRLLMSLKVSHKQTHLDALKMCEDFQKSKRRLIIIDYSGTLVETTSMDQYMKQGGTARSWHYEKGGSKRPGGCLETRDPISDTTRGRIIDLCRDPANTVCVVSSDLRDELDHALAGIENLALIAENGFVFRTRPNDPWKAAVDDDHSGGGDWYGGNSSEGYYVKRLPSRASSSMSSTDVATPLHSQRRNTETDSAGGDSSETNSNPGDVDVDEHESEAMQDWQNQIGAIMRRYSNRTNGAFVWQSPSAISFNYVLSDPDLGALQAVNLQLELEQETVSMPLTVEPAKGSVTVRLHGVNRGTAVRELINYLKENSNKDKSGKSLGPIDFIACFGDDNEDERSFSATNRYRANDPSVFRYTVRIGASDHSKAKHFLHHPDDLTELLGSILEASMPGQKVRRIFSQGDFGSNGAGDSLLGNFKTKQSYVMLHDQTQGHGEVPPAQEPTSPMSRGPMNASYVASAQELEELFGSQDEGGVAPKMQSMRPPLSIPPSASTPDTDPRRIPPTSPSRELDGVDMENENGLTGQKLGKVPRDADDKSDLDNDEFAHSDGDGALHGRMVREETDDSQDDSDFHEAIFAADMQNGWETAGQISPALTNLTSSESSRKRKSELGIDGSTFHFLELALAALSGAGLTYFLLRKT